MRKKNYIFPLIAAAMGIVGAIIRFAALSNVYDEYGKVIQHHPAATVMTLYTVICCLILAVFAFFSTKNSKNIKTFENICTHSNIFERTVMIILGILLCFVSVGYYISVELASLDMLYALFGFLSGISTIVISLTIGNNSSSITRCVFALPTPIFACLWLIILYRTNAGNPALFEYGNQCLAIASIALAYFYIGSFIFGEGQFRRTVGLCLIATFLCFISAVDNTGIQRFYYVIHGIILCICSAKFLSCPDIYIHMQPQDNNDNI